MKKNLDLEEMKRLVAMKISGYTTVRNGVEMDYPFEAAIRSLLDFCDEVVVVDSSDKQDGTSERLEALANEDKRVQVFQVEVPWDAPNFGIYDGQMKALAREQCTGDFLFQLDSDEVVQPGSRGKIEEILKKVNYLKETPLLALPVVEYWGGPSKVRIDVNPWKWRLSRNDTNITHGIPQKLRWHKDGLLYARPGTDGCDYISTLTGEPVPCIHFVTPHVEQIRIKAMNGDKNEASMYQYWFTTVTEQLPTVLHFSWWSIYSKIMKYKHFWNDSWLTLYGEKQDKPAGWNPFFGNRPLAEIPDDEIKEMAKKLATETGGWIFHQPWDGSNRLSVQLPIEIPEVIKPWAESHL
jgi:glycosyltransferase involved in cell wall biosynthesis